LVTAAGQSIVDDDKSLPDIPDVGSNTDILEFLFSCKADKLESLINYCKCIAAGEVSIDRFKATKPNSIATSYE
jgi:hypothetical protein